MLCVFLCVVKGSDELIGSHRVKQNAPAGEHVPRELPSERRPEPAQGASRTLRRSRTFPSSLVLLPLGLLYRACRGSLVSCGHCLSFSFLAEGKGRITSAWHVPRKAESISLQQKSFEEMCTIPAPRFPVLFQNGTKRINAIWNAFASCL